MGTKWEKKMVEHMVPTFTCDEPGCNFSVTDRYALTGHCERNHTYLASHDRCYYFNDEEKCRDFAEYVDIYSVDWDGEGWYTISYDHGSYSACFRRVDAILEDARRDIARLEKILKIDHLKGEKDE